MVALPESLTRTAAEYLEWEASQEWRYEFIDGKVVAMTGGTIAHNDLALNLNEKLRPHLRPKGCRVNVADVKVLVEATGNYFYPDLVVSCDDRDREAQTELRFPVLLVEVLSPGTESSDRGRKWHDYRAIPSLQEYLLVSSHRVSVECFRRRDELWLYQAYSSGEILTLESAGLSIAIDNLYEGVMLAENEA